MTRLSLTLRLIPHCWPQKQQCVGTTLSGSTPVSARIPSMRLRCGPHALARASSDLGSVAIAFPKPSLRDGEHRAAAGGADALIVMWLVRTPRPACGGGGRGGGGGAATRQDGAPHPPLRGTFSPRSGEKALADLVVVSQLALDL